jgi:hypothetical protein
MARCAVRAAFSGAGWERGGACGSSLRPLERGRGRSQRDAPAGAKLTAEQIPERSSAPFIGLPGGETARGGLDWAES